MAASLAIALRFDGKVAVGDLLTVATVLLSAAALLVAWGRERRARQRERANAVRAAASETLAKLERWVEIARSFYETVEPVIVDVSGSLAGGDFDVLAARDRLWRELASCRVETQKRILDEDIELAYVGLQIYDTRVYEQVVELVAGLRAADVGVYDDFRAERAQEPILALRGTDPRAYNAASLGNRLRSAATAADRELARRTEALLQPVRAYLLHVIASSDGVLLGRSARMGLTQVAIPPVPRADLASEASAVD